MPRTAPTRILVAASTIAPPAPLAYSYLRFSSDQQADGDSTRRQTELRDGWLARSGAALDTSLNMRDEGVSAFTGTHRQNPDRHALAGFLELARRGRIRRGSYLIVESLDRLSREHIRPALTLLLNLIDHGIRVVQLLPVEQVFDEHVEPMTLMMAIMELSRGHSESRMKAERIGRAWREKQRRAGEGELMTTLVPAWVRVAPGPAGKMELIPERAAVVKRVYRLCIDGLGADAITKVLNADRVPPFKPGATSWSNQAVQWLLKSRATYGEYQPRESRREERAASRAAAVAAGRKFLPPRPLAGPPVSNYYPAAVTEKTWTAAREAIARRRRRPGGRPGRFPGIFSGLLKDARDGSSLVVVTKAKKRLLVSLWGTQGRVGSKYISFPLVPFEREILDQLEEVNERDVIPDDDGRGAEDELAAAGQLERVREQLARVREQAEENPDVRSLVASMRRLEEKEAALVSRVEEVRRAAAVPLREAWREFKSLAKVLDETPEAEREAMRLRVRAAVAQVVDRVWVVFTRMGTDHRDRVAIVQVWFVGGGHREYGIFYSAAVKGAADREERVVTESFAVDGGDAWAKGKRFDLRDREKAARFVKVIEAAVGEGTGESGRDFASPWPQILRRLRKNVRTPVTSS